MYTIKLGVAYLRLILVFLLAFPGLGIYGSST
jgi:hypothetical protein